jgi:hypothetical protein
LDRYTGRARQALGEDAAQRVWNAGRLIPFDDAMAMALDAGSAASSP